MMHIMVIGKYNMHARVYILHALSGIPAYYIYMLPIIYSYNNYKVLI